MDQAVMFKDGSKLKQIIQGHVENRVKQASFRFFRVLRAHLCATGRSKAEFGYFV